MKKTLLTEILFWLLSFTLGSILLLTFTNIYSFHQKTEIDNMVEDVSKLHLLCLKEFKLHTDFLNQESINPQFFITGNSNLIDQNKHIDDSIKTILNKIKNNHLTKNTGCLAQFTLVCRNYEMYVKLSDTVSNVLLLRGFKDWGYEGKMRENAHALEQFKDVDKITVLQLRRREKDFILRLDTAYIKQVKGYADSLIDKAKRVQSINNSTIIKTAEVYKLYFDSLVFCELQLGIRNHSGLMKKSDDIALTLDNEMSTLVHMFDIQKTQLYETMYFYYAFIIISFVLISIFISFHVAHKISRPIKILSENINDFVESDFNLLKKLSVANTNLEVEMLYLNYDRMQTEINSYLNYFKLKVAERTKEIHQQLEEINQQKDLIERQKAIVDQHNKNITDSIRYALKIQQSMLPDEESLRLMVPDSFILYKPKDIVSGDFYFVDLVNIMGEEKLFFIAADGTGHGVPGAFMSLLGLNTINRTLYGMNETNPQVILSILNHALAQTLRKKNNKYIVADSMDVAFCKIDLKTRKMEFVGANRPCYIIRQDTLIEIKGNRFSIGSESVLKLELELTSHIIDLEPGDCVYIFTDGFCDQFGGNENKKFKKKDFVEILKSIHTKEVEEQKTILDVVFEGWKNNEAQTDDVLVMGIKIV